MKPITNTYYHTNVNPKTGEKTELVHVDYADGSSEDVIKDSIFDPTSKNYNAYIDELGSGLVEHEDENGNVTYTGTYKDHE